VILLYVVAIGRRRRHSAPEANSERQRHPVHSPENWRVMASSVREPKTEAFGDLKIE
jgi:hypothetical protein